MNSEPAFPNITPEMNIQGGPGLTKREWFAGMALQGLINNQNIVMLLGESAGVKALVDSCYQISDAMLTASKEKSDG